MPMAIVFFKRLDEGEPHRMILTLGREEHPLAHQIGKHADILVALAHTHFIDPNTTDRTKIRLGISGVHLAEEHPPEPGIGLAHQGPHFAHGHLAHEQQGEGLELLGEMRTQTFPRRPHPEDMTTLAALTAWQPAGDFTAMLEDVQMPPGQHLGVVVASRRAGVFGTADGFPQVCGFANLQPDGAAGPVETALHHFPVQTQAQQFMKQFFGCHAPSLPNGSTENSGEPEKR